MIPGERERDFFFGLASSNGGLQGRSGDLQGGSLAFILLYKHPRFFEKVALQTAPIEYQGEYRESFRDDSLNMPFSGKLHFTKGPGKALPLPFSWAQELIGKKNKIGNMNL
uniref:Uncharacterized protein n=1 Tax=Micrurus spixii TaxID=129469 RepID=A0A2D4MGV5_9SAUR